MPSVFDFAMISLFGCVFLFVSVFVHIQQVYGCFLIFFNFLLSHNINLTNKVKNLIRYSYIPSVFDFAMISLFGCVFLFVSVLCAFSWDTAVF